MCLGVCRSRLHTLYLRLVFRENFSPGTQWCIWNPHTPCAQSDCAFFIVLSSFQLFMLLWWGWCFGQGPNLASFEGWSVERWSFIFRFAVQKGRVGPALDSGDAFSPHTSVYIRFAWIACYSGKVLDLTSRGYAKTLLDCDGFLSKAMLLFFVHAHPHKTMQSPVATRDICGWLETACLVSVLVPIGTAQLKVPFKHNTGATHQFLQGHSVVASVPREDRQRLLPIWVSRSPPTLKNLL